MAVAKHKPVEQDPVVEKLESGEYERQLDLFQDIIDEATATLRRAYEAKKAENTQRS